MPNSSTAASVAIVADVESKFQALVDAVERASLKEVLDAASDSSGVEPEELRIFIKPDLTFFFKPATTWTDPELVECLVDWLHDAGYPSVSIGVARDSSEFWLENRDPLVLADLAGYRFETAKGRSYDVVDLSDDIEPVEFPPGSSLKGTPLARAWTEAHVRISFGKCKTDEQSFYSGAIQNLLGVLPMRDKELHYSHRVQPEDACNDLLKFTPVHYAIVDAYVANQGSAGARHAHPVYASTVIASANIQLADWTTAIKMGLDPYASRIVAKRLREAPLPDKPRVLGDLAPFPSFKNVHPMIVDSVTRRNASLEIQRSASAWLQTVDRQLFPFKDPFTDRVNAVLSYQAASLDANPAAFAAFLTLNYSLAGILQAVEGTKVLFAKDSLRWMERPLNVRIEDYADADYTASKTYMEPLEHLVLQLSPDQNGMRWQYMDKSILFHFARVLPIPFDEFVSRVDISKSVRMMNDYIGGACVPVRRDEAGRVTHQAERNIYLPQPNYIVFTGGQPIDVSKLEFVEYSPTEHKIFWRTIKSENNTGKFDDGIVAFTKAGELETRISVVGRQEFNLPPFWQLMNLDLNPIVKDYLVADAYRNFFNRTLANFETNFEGREHRIGQPWPDSAQDTAAPPLPSERLGSNAKELADRARVTLDRLSSRISFSSPKPEPAHVDEHGFSHFHAPAAGTAPAGKSTSAQKVASASVGFFKDLIEAIGRDLATRDSKEPRS